MIRIHCSLEGFDPNESWAFSFDSPRQLCRFLRKLGNGQLKVRRIARIFSIVEGV